MKKGRGFNGWVHVILFLVVLSWGFNNIAMKIGFRYLSAPQFSGMRVLVGLPFMLYFAFWMPGRIRFTKQDFLGIVTIGSLGLGLFLTLFPIGIDETSSSLGGILMATMPIHVVILSLVFRFERPEWKSIVGVLLTIVGLILITIASHQPDTATQNTLKGILFIIIAELGYAINTTFLRPYMKRYNPLQVTGLAMASAVVVFMLVFFSEMKVLSFSKINAISWICIIYSGLIAFLLGNVLWNFAIKGIGSTKVAVYGNLPPVMVIILSAIIFHDVLNFTQMVGALIILSGVVLVQLRTPDPVEKLQKNGLSVDD